VIPSLSAWADALGVARETASRGFSRAYNVPTRQFRLETRVRRAWLRIARSREPLVAIAQVTGFADQAHMTRAVRALTGTPPSAWRVMLR
jgi:AraC-like DNA-binding protein